MTGLSDGTLHYSGLWLTKVRALVFDMDGVLVNSAGCHREAFEEVFSLFGVRDFEYSRYAGWRTPEVIEAVLRPILADLSKDQVEDLARRKSHLARQKLIATNPVTEGCVPVLEALAAKYTLALASSGSRESVELFLATNQCSGLFRSVLCGNDVRQAKPDPEIYERTFRALEVSPAEGVVVEDAVSGIAAAKAAGTYVVIGLSGTSTEAELKAAGADHVAGSLYDLTALLCPV